MCNGGCNTNSKEQCLNKEEETKKKYTRSSDKSLMMKSIAIHMNAT